MNLATGHFSRKLRGEKERKKKRLLQEIERRWQKMSLSLYAGKLFRDVEQAVKPWEHCSDKKAICLAGTVGA